MTNKITSLINIYMIYKYKLLYFVSYCASPHQSILNTKEGKKKLQAEQTIND